ncbi:dTDP-4-dehydrorhamnose 3,5-epimerase family protein [Neiella marina]|uniref:dTDP-4-dehydrorhamnose 3,5-epimerase n=1 Tax=Neiella holothuriorum TaxID=2870530 RepID=A0ABS7EET5_9GAMM|nr:dTDP-4-dehydrorhamnose 3,5-epimerase family protein [Neiella holothuriorum]MBW8190828.1 dTDP-4-dehydrorhamnose 3,5-epimerase family protein [Neiella holothuriorum]
MQQDFSLEPLPLADAYRIRHKVFADERGMFKRIGCHQTLLSAGIDAQVRQVNCSLTPTKGTVRGMHFQLPPAAEVKIVNCFQGELFDVLTDLRPSSPTYLQWYGERLSADSHTSLIIPQGFAHGFQALTNDVLMMYLNSTDYAPELESGLHPQDPALSIAWPLPVIGLSEKDASRAFIADNFTGVKF